MLPLWLEIAFTELENRVQEKDGPSSHPRIAQYLHRVGMAENDEIPWCAAFVNWCLDEAGPRGTGKANARSYLAWGDESPRRVGAIVVLTRGVPSGWEGHVGFLLDWNDWTLTLLGGNQSNRVSIASYPASRLLGFRWPKP